MQWPDPVPCVFPACCKGRCQRFRQRTTRQFGAVNPGAALGRHLTGRIRPRFHDRDRHAAARQPHRSSHAGQAAVDHQDIVGIQDGKIALRQANGHGTLENGFCGGEGEWKIIDSRISLIEQLSATLGTAANLPLTGRVFGWPTSFPNAGLGSHWPHGPRIPVRFSLRRAAPWCNCCVAPDNLYERWH